MATHSSILAWRIPWTEESVGGYSPWGRKELDRTERLSLTQPLLNDIRSGTSLAVPWLRLYFHCREHGFGPWLGN